jgi:hypothetical protein
MTMPGFTADAAFYEPGRLYRMAADTTNSMSARDIVPALRLEEGINIICMKPPGTRCWGFDCWRSPSGQLICRSVPV